ncbi:MAG TPA: sigma-70 family RNA polymerase sigma factor [Dictyobacter sp.]|nr:sigma-70 family RNA polymerase sigma factor [Dictyobacter sp.]
MSSKNKKEQQAQFVQHRSLVALTYQTLPVYNSVAFWQCLEQTNMFFEVLVKVFRSCVQRQDAQGSNRVFAVMLQRIKKSCECWAYRQLRRFIARQDELELLVHDLCGDVYEMLYRALIDERRSFWEEHFFYMLSCERNHVLQAFMMREGWRQRKQIQYSRRIPRALVAGYDVLLDIEDESAQRMLVAIEQADILRFVLRLPEPLRHVIVLLFWAEKTQKDVAHILNVSDRTVRNRLREACSRLQVYVEEY